MSAILGIDPGPVESAYVLWQPDPPRVLAHGIRPNQAVLVETIPQEASCADYRCAIEMITSYGMPVGREVFETCVWIGRFADRWCTEGAGDALLVPRKDVKLHICGSPRATDSNIRWALISRFGIPGIKAKPGLLYGIRADEWQALALAVTVADGVTA